jgi:hypothetical protein
MTKYDTIKKEFPKALLKNLGLVATTCREMGISRETYYRWINEDPEFKEECEEANEISIDTVIRSLYREILKGNITAIIYYLNKKGHTRGYKDKGGREIVDIRKKCNTLEEINESYNEIWYKVTAGELSSDTANSMSKILENKRKAIETKEIVLELVNIKNSMNDLLSK